MSNVAVSANGGQISGAILDKDGQPLSHTLTEIRLLNSPAGDDPPEPEQVRALSPDGRYSIRHLRPGKYWLLVTDPQHSGDVASPGVMKVLITGVRDTLSRMMMDF